MKTQDDADWGLEEHLRRAGYSPEATAAAERRLYALGGSLINLLPQVDLAKYIELVDVGEYGIALENLCTQICEQNVAISIREASGPTSLSPFRRNGCI